MRSVIVTGPGQIAVETVPDPVLTGAGDALVRVQSAAICGSDLHFYDGDLPFFPVAVGHEVIGEVVEVGADVRRFRPGDRVLVASVAGCGDCVGCAAGDPVTCVQGPKVFGSGELGGGQSELLAVPAADFQLLRIPDGVDDEAALLLTDNLGTGWAGAQRADIPPGGTVVVLGLGAVGQCAVRSALLQGAGQVLAYDPVAGRRELAAKSGAVSVDGPLLDAVMEATGGRGADSVIDAVAIDATIDDAFDRRPRRRHRLADRRARHEPVPAGSVDGRLPQHHAADDDGAGPPHLGGAGAAGAARPVRHQRPVHAHVRARGRSGGVRRGRRARLGLHQGSSHPAGAA